MGSGSCLFKIKCGQVLRRIHVPVHGIGIPDMSFRELERTIRRQFEFPVASTFAIVYADKENDEVAMANDDDMYDACFIQKLNPVRLTVLPEEEEESRSSAHDARPPEPLTVDPPPWAGLQSQQLCGVLDLVALLVNVSSMFPSFWLPVSLILFQALAHACVRMFFAVDISLKLDQLLLAVNKLLVVPVAASGRPTSTKIEDHFVVVDDSPIDDPTPKKMEERFLIKGEPSIAGPTIEPAKDAVPSK